MGRAFCRSFRFRFIFIFLFTLINRPSSNNPLTYLFTCRTITCPSRVASDFLRGRLILVILIHGQQTNQWHTSYWRDVTNPFCHLFGRLHPMTDSVTQGIQEDNIFAPHSYRAEHTECVGNALTPLPLLFLSFFFFFKEKNDCLTKWAQQSEKMRCTSQGKKEPSTIRASATW